MRAAGVGAKNVPRNGIKDGEKNAYQRSGGGSGECALSSFHSVERFAAPRPLFVVCMAQFFAFFPSPSPPLATFFLSPSLLSLLRPLFAFISTAWGEI